MHAVATFYELCYFAQISDDIDEDFPTIARWFNLAALTWDFELLESAV
jgi:hypothetical protein